MSKKILFIFSLLLFCFPVIVKADSQFSKNLLENFYQYNWENQSDEQRKILIQELVKESSSILEIKEPTLSFYFKDELTEAQYNFEQNIIYLNENILFSSIKTFQAINHEIRHAYQWKKACNPNTDIDIKFKENFNNYISSETNFNLYESQLIEVDARIFADWTYYELLASAGRVESKPLKEFIPY